MNTSQSTDPKDHIGHTVVEDKFSRDFKRSRPPGNGWCHECQTPVCIEVFEGGILEEMPPEDPHPKGEQ